MDRIVALYRVKGRASRLTYWKINLLTTLVTAVIWCGGLLLSVVSGVGALSAVALVGPLTMLPVGVAIGIRRLHDRNKSGWWLLIFLGVSIVILLAMGQMQNPQDLTSGLILLALTLASLTTSIWYFVEVGCLRGTPGPNRFGADPLGPEAATVSLAPAVS